MALEYGQAVQSVVLHAHFKNGVTIRILHRQSGHREPEVGCGRVAIGPLFRVEEPAGVIVISLHNFVRGESGGLVDDVCVWELVERYQLYRSEERSTILLDVVTQPNKLILGGQTASVEELKFEALRSMSLLITNKMER